MKLWGTAYLFQKGFHRKRSVDVGYSNDEPGCVASVAQFVEEDKVPATKSDFQLIEPHVIRTLEEDDDILCLLGWKPYK